MEKFSTINLRESNQSKKVRIGSDLKPVIQEKIITKWQSLIDTAARIVNVPSGLIMRLNEKTIEVFLKSNTPGNPYENGEEADLVYGLYCETVVGTQEKLIVPDASKSSVWKDNNPDVDINMISYLGFPINWPDGEVFGTVCMLDNKENHYTSDYENLLMQVKDHLENDLELLITNQELKEKSKQLEQLSKTKSRFLSLISHDVRGNIATNDEFIKMIIEDLDQYNNDSLKPLLESISKSTTESREILEDLLSWSRNDILQLKPEPEEINITAVIDKILRFFHHGISIKNINVQTSYYTANALIRSDENMLTVALRNIISNAIKYNYKNGDLKISVKKQDDKHIISIGDTGRGMPQETIDRLFTYEPGQSRGTHREDSAGIGLILTKEFLDKLGAEISVSSKPGLGTNVELVLPK